MLSSLIVYRLGENKFGIGSIATFENKRKNGYASRLISGVIDILEKDFDAQEIYLYSDIDPEFYERFKFVKLPENNQRYKTSTCMVRKKIIMLIL